MELTFEEVTEKDIPELTKVMARAFDDDAQKHMGIEKGGPPGYDNGDFFRTWLLPYKESIGYKIISDRKVIGGIIVWILETKENFVGTIFIDPAFQDRGVGTQAWQFIEETYPDTKKWTLETPSWAVKNHHFYEQKCGFKKVGEKEEEDPDLSGTSFVYQKIMEDCKE
jgi:ribosomal protein S18 acetylase RimI-like enzyme